jgi:hypothetical protein
VMGSLLFLIDASMTVDDAADVIVQVLLGPAAEGNGQAPRDV